MKVQLQHHDSCTISCVQTSFSMKVTGSSFAFRRIKIRDVTKNNSSEVVKPLGNFYSSHFHSSTAHFRMTRVTSIFSVHISTSSQSPVCGLHSITSLRFNQTGAEGNSYFLSQFSSESGGNVRDRGKMRATLFVLSTHILHILVMTKGWLTS